MTEQVELQINGRMLRVRSGTTVAAALAIAGEPCRRSLSGEPRAALCGMGICFECSARVDGEAHCRTCQTLCRAGMEVWTDE